MGLLGATQNRRKVIADAQLGNVTGAIPTTWYLGLSTSTPNDDGTGFTEPVGGAYARVTIANNTTNWPNSTVVNGLVTKTNGAKFTFPNPTGSWGLVTYWGLFTASSGGVPEWHGLLDTPITPRAGNSPVEFDLAAIALTFSAA